jgi:hypothetical protein
VCVLVLMLWVRSYWYVNFALEKAADGVFVLGMSAPGVFCISFQQEEFIPSWTIFNAIMLRGGLGNMSNSTLNYLPFVILGLAFLAGLAGRHIRSNGIPSYSLRTLLLVLTLLALVMGLASWAVK